jgi:hypothetical protein
MRMLKKLFPLCLIIFLSGEILPAQDNTIINLKKESSVANNKTSIKTDTTKVWQKGLLYNLNFSQASLTNWSAGGDKFSVSMGSILNLFAKYAKNKTTFDNSFDFNFGYVRFDLVSKYGRVINEKANFAILGNLRSGFFKGYAYTTSKKDLISNFMAPGYFLVSSGIDYRPSKNISVFLSPITARWIYVMDPLLSSKGLYGVKPGEKSSAEIGAFATLNILKEIAPNIIYKGKLDLFANYINNPQNVDLFMTNLLSVKLSKILNMSWAVDMIYDDDARIFGPTKSSPALQLKSQIGIGFQLKTK